MTSLCASIHVNLKYGIFKCNLQSFLLDLLRILKKTGLVALWKCNLSILAYLKTDKLQYDKYVERLNVPIRWHLGHLKKT